MREFYEKLPDGTFQSVGYEFSGFPTNGIWQVVDGHQNCIIQLDKDPNPTVPPLKIPVLALQNRIISTLPYSCSISDAVQHTLHIVATTQPDQYPELCV